MACVVSIAWWSHPQLYTQQLEFEATLQLHRSLHLNPRCSVPGCFLRHTARDPPQRKQQIWMMPTSSGWSFEVAFAGRKSTFVALRSGILWLEQLSSTTSTFRFCCSISLSNETNQGMKISLVIHALVFASYATGTFTPRKHLGLMNLPMVIRGSFSDPSMLQQRSTVILSFDFFPPWHFSPLNANVLLGRSLQKRAVSSRLNTSFGSKSCKVGFKTPSTHESVTSSLTAARSPLTVLKLMPCLFFHRCSHPSLHVQSPSPMDSASSLALAFNMGPLMGTFCDLHTSL